MRWRDGGLSCYAQRIMTITDSLSITCGQRNTDNAVAIFQIDECFRDYGFPESICGRFLGATLGRLLRLASGRDIRVGFRGGRYQFAVIGADGSFVLHRYREA